MIHYQVMGILTHSISFYAWTVKQQSSLDFGSVYHNLLPLTYKYFNNYHCFTYLN